MKLSLKDNLKKFNLIIEGWQENLSNKYSEDILIFVGRMLQMTYSNEDISNHPLAEWIAKTSKVLGDFPWSETNKVRNEEAYQIILKFVKDNDDELELISSIKSKNAKDALKYVKDEIEKEKNKTDENISPEEELNEWFSDGLIEFIGRGLKGSIWVKPLRVEFFDVVQCGTGPRGSQEVGEFGIGCQRKLDGGFGAVGFDRSSHKDGQTYSLLTKADNGYYTSLISFAGKPDTNSFVGDAAQFKNKQIGAESALGWSSSEILNTFVDFLISNPYGKKIYKGESFHKDNRKFGALIKEENRDILFRLLKNRPEIVDYYEEQLKTLLGEDALISLKIKARELYNQNPKEFIKNLSVYLKSEEQETLKILSEINFESFINEYGEDVILENINNILKTIDYENFNALIRPFISYNKFLKQVDKNEIKEFIRNFSEKVQNSKNTLPIVSNFIESEKDFETIMKNFGKGNIENGIRAFLISLATPRMSKHKNYTRKTDGTIESKIKEPRRDEDRNLIDSENRIILKDGTIYDEQGNLLDFGGDENRKREYVNSRIAYDEVSAEIKEGQWILDYKSIRNLLKQNKNKIVKVLGGGKSAEIKWLEYYLSNSSEQERAEELKKNSDDFISEYDDLYEVGKSDLPGVLQFSKTLSQRNKIKMISGFSDGFNKFDEYVYNTDKRFLQDEETRDKIIKHYRKKSNRPSKNLNRTDGIIAYLYTLQVSNFSHIDIEKKLIFFTQVIQNKFKFSIEEILDFIIIFLETLPEDKIGVFKKFIDNNILSDKTDLGYKIQMQKVGKNPSTGVSTSNKDVEGKLSKIRKIMNQKEDLNEHKIRKYIQKLLENNFKIN